MASIYSLRKMDGGYDVVAMDGRVVGHTYRDPEQAWSYAPWIIEGVRESVLGGVNGTQKRLKGWRTRAAAAQEIAIMNSAAICAAILA